MLNVVIALSPGPSNLKMLCLSTGRYVIIKFHPVRVLLFNKIQLLHLFLIDSGVLLDLSILSNEHREVSRRGVLEDRARTHASWVFSYTKLCEISLSRKLAKFWEY